MFDKNTKIKVKNSTNTTSNPPRGYKSWLDWYFKGDIPSSMKCPSCGRMMTQYTSPYMVGGHVESAYLPIFKYITPICNECNCGREYLLPFHVKIGDLKTPPFR